MGSIAEFGGVINDFLGEGRGSFAAPMLDILVYMIPHACMIYYSDTITWLCMYNRSRLLLYSVFMYIVIVV